LCPPREHRSREINRVGKNMPCEINVANLAAIQGRRQGPACVRKKRKDFILTKEAHEVGFPSCWFLPYNGVLQGHDSRLVHLTPDQLQPGLFGGGRQQRYPPTEQHWYHRDLDGVYQPGIEQAAEEGTSAKEPDVLARLCAQTGHRFFEVVADDHD